MRIADDDTAAEPGLNDEQTGQPRQRQGPTSGGKHPSEAESINDVFPEGENVIVDELPVGPPQPDNDESPEQEPESGPQKGESQQEGQPQGQEGEDGEPEEGGPEQADDVATSATLDKVRKRAGLDVEDEDDLVEQVNQMQTNLRGTETLRQLAREEVPELGQVISSMLQNFGEDGQLDTTAFYMTLDEQLPGVTVNAPAKNEDPDGYSDFQLRAKERRKELQEKREKQKELQRKQQQIRQDYEQAWESFKGRHDLDDEEAQSFKQWFGKTFYGDQEKGRLPRKDVFDMAYQHYADGEEQDLEETEAYKKGYNQAIEEMKGSGAGSGDNTPNMMSGAGGGNDRAREGTSENEQIMNTLYSEEELRGEDDIHSQF
jgi:hypothetical protein